MSEAHTTKTSYFTFQYALLQSTLYSFSESLNSKRFKLKYIEQCVNSVCSEFALFKIYKTQVIQIAENIVGNKVRRGFSFVSDLFEKKF